MLVPPTDDAISGPEDKFDNVVEKKGERFFMNSVQYMVPYKKKHVFDTFLTLRYTCVKHAKL